MLTERARAKVNLCLHITGRRADGFHRLDSLVVFPDIADELRFAPGPERCLTIDGPFAAGLGVQNNLVLDAMAAGGASGAAHLTKNLPVAAGIGGGSADAAAMLRLAARASGSAPPKPQQVAALGADVPVCLASEPVRMRGIGKVLEPVPPLPPLAILLINPGVALETRAVFAGLERVENAQMTPVPQGADADTFIAYLDAQRNDMQEAAERLVPEISRVINALQAIPACRLARMSGSGSTCFGLFDDLDSAKRAAQSLARPDWWLRAAML